MLQHVKSLPCCYCVQPKSWMSSFFFDEWVKELDRKFEKENQKIVIVDNCPGHPIVDRLKAIELVFLPPNTTSKTLLLGSKCDTFSENKVLQKDHKTTNPSREHEKETPTNVNIRCDAAVTTCFVRNIGINHKELFSKKWDFWKISGAGVNEEDDPSKDITADLEETVTELCE